VICDDMCMLVIAEHWLVTTVWLLAMSLATHSLCHIVSLLREESLCVLLHLCQDDIFCPLVAELISVLTFDARRHVEFVSLGI
jgi:hypothetical protein